MPAPVETDPRAGTRVAPDRLHAWIRRAFERMGVPPDDAEVAATTLLAADVRGVESHGVARLPYYHAKIVAGTMDPAAELTVERESAATLVLDSHSGIGLVHAARAMARTVAKAEAGGLCMTTVRHANHFGIAGAHALAAARAGLAAIATTNATPLVVPTYGAEGMLGTNPIAFAVPTGPVGSGAPPLVADLASSTVAWGKIEIARRDGKPVPLGWALDEQGRPTTDPAAAHWLTPLGGDREHSGQKGYALALMIDTLCGPLAGSSWGRHIGAFRGTETPSNLGFWFVAWRIDAFRDPADFYADVTRMLAELRESPRAADAPHAVLAPGDPELEKEREAHERGIFLTAPVLANLAAVGDAVGLAIDF